MLLRVNLLLLLIRLLILVLYNFCDAELLGANICSIHLFGGFSFAPLPDFLVTCRCVSCRYVGFYVNVVLKYVNSLCVMRGDKLIKEKFM